jgi:hypothetical protein
MFELEENYFKGIDYSDVIEFIGDRAQYDQYGGTYIWGRKESSEALQMIGEVRGWGAIQNKFDDIEEAGDFQDKLGAFIALAITEKIKREKNKS